MATVTNEPALTKSQLVEVVQTGLEIKGVSRMRALAMLRRRPRRDAGDFLKELVADRGQPPRLRHMAAMGLYELGGRRAEQALVDAAPRADDQVASVIALGLGRIGAPGRMATVEEMGRLVPDHLKQQAEFSATLLAYRHGLPGHVVRAPTGRQLQALPIEDALEIKITKATARQVEAAVRALVDQPLEVKLSSANAHRLQCEPNTFLWMWTEKASDDFGAIGAGVAGLLFRKSRFDESYALSAIGLTTPRRTGPQLTVHRAESGQVMYMGSVAPDGSMQLQARSFPGAAAVDIQVVVKRGAVEVRTAKSASVARAARTPKVA